MTSVIFTIPKSELESIVNSSFNLFEVLNKLGLSGRGHSYEYLHRRLQKDNINYSHLKRVHVKRYSCIDEILVENSTFKSSWALKRKLIKLKLKTNICEICKQLPFHNNKPLSLQLDHINGNNKDNRLSNLQIICPNCHTQTITYSGKNKKKPEKIISCNICGKNMNAENMYGMCKKCFNKSSQKQKIMKKVNRKHNKKFEITKDELEKLVMEKPFTQIGKMFGVSDNAIRKRCKSLGIIIPKFEVGHWLKKMESPVGL